MELFKLAGKIVIDGEAEASRVLQAIASKATSIATQISDKLEVKLNVDTRRAEDAFEDLSTTIAAQERVLESLKRDYSSVVLEQGKNSKSARTLSKEIKSVSKELNENKTKLNSAEQAADKFDRTLDDLGDSAKSAGNGGFTVLKGALSNLVAQGFSKLVSAGTELISGAASYQSSLEGYNTSFTVMTGSAEKAAQVTEQLGVIAAETPFEMTTLADTTQLLMNYGLSADDAMAKMKMLGDISQGNSDKMGRVAMAYGQMSSAGKVHLEDVKQMIEAGFNPLQEISETTGESMNSLYKRISKGTLSVDEITASMERSTSEGGKYFGSMEMQAQTFQGRLSTLKDTVNMSLGTALSGAMSRLSNEILPKVTAAIEKIDWETLGEKIAAIADKIIDLGLWVVDNWELVETGLVAIGAAILAWKVVGLIQSIVSALKGMTLAQAALNLVMSMNPIGLIVAAIAALIAAFVMLWNKCDWFREFWINLWEGIKKACANAWKWIEEKFSKAWQLCKDIWKAAGAWFSKIWSDIKNAFSNVGSWFREKFNSAKQGVQKAWSNVKNFFSSIWNGIKGVFSGIGGWFSDKFNSAKQSVQNAWSGVKSFFSGIFTSIKNTFAKVKDAITKPFRTAIDKVKGLFNKLKLKFPSIKLPHFSVSPQGWKIGDLLKGSIPKLSIDWYAKAMENGMILDEPTIFGMNSAGQLMGAGEVGSETVVGTGSLLNMINGAVREETNALSYRMDRVINLLSIFFPQILDNMGSDIVADDGAILARYVPKINSRLSDIQKRNGRGG